MRKGSCFGSVLLLVAVSTPQALALNGPSSTTPRTPAADLQVGVPGSTASRRGFEKNLGQWPDSIQFRAESKGSVLWFTGTGVYCEEFYPVLDAPADRSTVSGATASDGRPENRHHFELSHAWFDGAQPQAPVQGVGMLDYRSNYFLGNDASRWRSDVPSYESIVVHDVYPGVDVMYSLNVDAQLVCSVSHATTSSLNQVRWRTEGRSEAFQRAEESLKAGPGGIRSDDFTLSAADPSWMDAASVAAQAPAATMSLAVYWLKTLGSSGTETTRDIAVNKLGEACVVGFTDGSNFPTVNPYQTDQPVEDVIVTKFSADGLALLYSTYIGGDDWEYGYGIDVDTSNNIYIVGITASTDYPTMNPFKTNQYNNDGFVTKFSAAGNTLIYSTYLGAGGATPSPHGDMEEATDIFVDASGAAYVVGSTNADNFPTVSAFQTTKIAFQQAAFLTKLSPSGTSAIFSTYLGGFNPFGSRTLGYGVSVDDSGCAFVVGQTTSTDFPTLNPIVGTYQGLEDCYITKFAANGSSIHYSTYLGGTDIDGGISVALADSDQAVVGLTTWSSDFPTMLPYQANQPNQDIIVSKLNAAGSAFKFSTYLGGSAGDYCADIAVMKDGAIVVEGGVNSLDFPLVVPIPGTSEPFGGGTLTRFAPSLDHLIYSTYLQPVAIGGPMDVDSLENMYFTSMYGSGIAAQKLGYPILKPGDINVSGAITSADVILLVNYVFKGGAEPLPCASTGDVNCNGTVTSSDVIGLVNFVFKGGTPPCNPCVCP